MGQKMMYIIKLLFRRLKCKINPIKYYKGIGVKIGNGTRILSADTEMFSTEPWLVKIGDNCTVTYGCTFLTHDGGTLTLNKEEGGDFVICGNINVGDNVYIGTRTIILPGVNIGNNVIIGAGSVITKDIPDNTVAAGVPCKVISTREKYIQKIADIKEGKNTRYWQNLDDMHNANPNKK